MALITKGLGGDLETLVASDRLYYTNVVDLAVAKPVVDVHDNQLGHLLATLNEELFSFYRIRLRS